MTENATRAHTAIQPFANKDIHKIRLVSYACLTFSPHFPVFALCGNNKTKPMENTQKQKAMELYFAATLNNREIAEQVGVNRRTIMLWARQGNWQQQRELDRQLPALLIDRSYHLVNNLTSTLLTRAADDIDVRHAKTLHYLATGISRLKGKPDLTMRNTMFSTFIKQATPRTATQRQ